MKASARPVALAGALIVFGCSAGQEADRSAPVADRATELPDLSAMAPPVAEQLRAQFDQLTKAKGDSATPRDDLALAHGEMGKLLLAANAYLDAQPYFENARSLAPADARWTYYLAHTHRLEGQSTEAAALFAETVRARPDDVAALVWLGSAYLDQGNPAAAEPSFEKAVAIAPGIAAGHLGLGRVALERRQFAAAVTHLERVLTLEPNASAVHYPLALAQRALGHTAQAEAHLRQRGGNDLGPPDPLMQEVVDLLRSPVAHEGRGDKAIAAGDFTAAVRYLRRSSGAGARQRADPAQGGHGAVAGGGRARRACRAAGGVATLAGLSRSPLQPGRAAARRRPVGRGDRTVLGRGAARPHLSPGPTTAGQRAPAARPV